MEIVLGLEGAESTLEGEEVEEATPFFLSVEEKAPGGTKRGATSPSST